jgi:hypothetical protein
MVILMDEVLALKTIEEQIEFLKPLTMRELGVLAMDPRFLPWFESVSKILGKGDGHDA